MRKIHYFEDGGPADGGADNTSSAFNNNNNTNDNNTNDNNTSADNTPSTPANNTSGYFNNNAPAASPFAAFTQATRSPDQQAALDKLGVVNTARDAYTTAYQKAQEAGPVSPLDQAKLFKEFTQTAQDKWTKPATKNTEAIENNDLKFTVNPSDLTGLPVDRAVLKAMDKVGLGGVYGVNGNENQNAQNVIAAQNVNTALTVAGGILKNIIPGYGIVQFAADVLSGKTTPGQAIAGILGDRVASSFGIPPSMFQAAFNGDYGNGLAGWATSALNSYISKETKMDPRLTALAFNATGLPSLTKTSLSSLNVGPNINSAVAETIDSGLKNVGIGKGPATTSNNIPSLGADTKSQVDNILNPRTVSPTAAPLSLDTPSSPLSSVSPSSSDTARAISMPSLLNTSGLMRVGNGTQYAGPEKLNPLTYKQEQNYGIQQDPNAYATAASDIAKMEMLPFTQSPLMVASGGSIHHFADGGAGSSSMSSDGSMYGDLIQALSKFDSPDATPTASRPKPDLLRNGQIGYSIPPKIIPQLASLLQSRGMRLYAEGGQPDHEHPNYDGTPVFRTGGLEGLGGKYVEGKGDGTSDDITAMLANGEYVFSADVVSALGNGSNKAGAKELDHMVQAIRARARSAPPDKLPPDAKSPLEYLQSKGKNHGTN